MEELQRDFVRTLFLNAASLNATTPHAQHGHLSEGQVMAAAASGGIGLQLFNGGGRGGAAAGAGLLQSLEAWGEDPAEAWAQQLMSSHVLQVCRVVDQRMPSCLQAPEESAPSGCWVRPRLSTTKPAA